MNLPLFNLRYSTGGALVADMLFALGIEYIFTIPGSQTLPVMHGISKKRSIRVVVSRSERNSVFMAEGYGKAMGFPAVTLSTLGPGIANELPSLYSATQNNSPVVSISPFQPPWKIPRIGEIFQGLDHPEFLKSIVKKNYIVNEIEMLPEIITNSLEQSLEEPKGPVHIDISFPILFKSHIYFNFEKKNLKKECFADVYIIYEKLEFSKFLELSMFPLKGKISELRPGDATGTLPFALGVKFSAKEKPLIVFLTLENMLMNLDSIAVATANDIKPLIISFKESSQLQKIADVFKIEYKKDFSNILLQKSNTINIVVVD